VSLMAPFCISFFDKRFPCFLLKAPITFRFQVSGQYLYALLQDSLSMPLRATSGTEGLEFTVSCWVRGLQAIIGGLKLLASSSTRHWFSSSAVHQSGLPSSQAAAATLSPRLRPGRRRKLGQWATSEASASVPDRAAAATGLLLPFFSGVVFATTFLPFCFPLFFYVRFV
jgi:hypothetical protein